MTKQISTLVSTQWLLPLFNEQLNELHKIWNDAYHKSSVDDFESIASDYHDFVARLDIAHLPLFRYLGICIETFLHALADDGISINQALIPLYASELLQYELNSYAKTGKYQVALLFRRSGYLIGLLEKSDVDVSAIKAIDTPNIEDYTAENKGDYDAFYLLESMDIPAPDNAQSLTTTQLHSLISAWRHSVQHLLYLKENHPPTLSKLKQVAEYLWSDAAFQGLSMKQALWYLAVLWFEALTHNQEPKPSIYANILSDLDKVIMSIEKENDEHNLVKALLVDIYIQLCGLNSVSGDTSTTLQDIQEKLNLNNDGRFLPRILKQLEKLIFMLDTPLEVIKPLQYMQTQLASRGWYMYEQQIEQVLQELYAVKETPDSYEMTRWQIERQLQELYGAILNSDETIDTLIGDGQLTTQPAVDMSYGLDQVNDSHDEDDGFVQIDTQSDVLLESNQYLLSSDSDLESTVSTDTSTDTAIEASDHIDTHVQQGATSDEIDVKAMRKVRIAVEDIKTAFGSYLYTHSIAELPHSDIFDALQQTFDEIQLYDVTHVIEQCASVFAEIKEYELDQLTWRLTDTIADGLAVLEFFLDYLAHQTLDMKLLNEALERFESARTQLVELSQSPMLAQETLPTAAVSPTDTIRYDDSGEVTVQEATDSMSHPSPVSDSDSVSLTDTQSFTDIQDDWKGDDNSNTESSENNQPVVDNERENADSKIEISPEAELKLKNLEGSEPKVRSDESDTVESATAEVQIDKSSVTDTPELQAARATLKDDNFDLDEDINEIFIEEAQEVSQELDSYLPIWQEDVQDLTPLSEIRRGFHTLKGSGRMVGAYNVAELAWGVENLLNRVLDNTLPVSDELVTLVVETKSLIPILVADFEQKRPPSIDPAVIIAKANNLLEGNPVNQGVEHLDDFAKAYQDNSAGSEQVAADADADALFEATATEVVKTGNEGIQTLDDDNLDDDHKDLQKTLIEDPSLSDSEILAQDVTTVDNESSLDTESAQVEMPDVLAKIFANIEIPQDDEDSDEDIKEIFIEEAGEVLANILPIFKSWRSDHSADNLLGDIRRGFHTLKGSGRMVGALYTAELAWAVEAMLNRILDDTIEVVPGMVSMLYDVLEKFPHMVDIFEQNRTDYPSISKLWVACANAYSKGLGAQFDYDALKVKWLANTEQDVDSAKTRELKPATDTESNDLSHESADKVLESLQTANVKLAEAGLPKPSVDDEEQAFLDIFLEEAGELVDTIKSFIADNKEAENIDVDDDVVRAFHTLRGAAGCESLKEVSEISATVEQSLRLLQQHEQPITRSHLEVLEQSVMLIDQFINQCMLGGDEATDESTDTQTQHTVENQQKVDAVKQMFDASITTQQLNTDKFDIAKIISDDIEDLLDAQWELKDRLSQGGQDAQQYTVAIKTQIEKLSGRVSKSATFMSLLTSLHGVYSKLVSEPSLIVSQSADEHDAQSQDYLINTLIAAHEALTELFDALAGSMSLHIDNNVIASLYTIAKPTPIKDLMEVASRYNAVPDSQKAEDSFDVLDIEEITTDVELLEIFLEEAHEIDANIHEIFAQWRDNPSDLDSLKVLQRHLHTIKGGARMAGISSIGDLTHEAETVYELFVNGKLTPTEDWVNVMQQVQDVLSQQIDYVIEHHESFFVKGLVEQLEQFANDAAIPKDVELDIPSIETAEDVSAESAPSPEDTDTDTQVPDSLNVETKFQSVVISSWGGVRPDEDILNVFLEEAREIVDSSSEHLRTFRSNTSDLSVLKTLQRDLHTIKGGARMVPANGIADLAHQMETVYEDLASRRRPATKMVGQLLEACHDWMASAIALLEYNINPPLPNQLIGALKSFSKNPDSLNTIRVDSLQFYQDLIQEYDAFQASKTEHYSINEPPPSSGGFDRAQEQSNLSNEMIRISSSLMERMINLSGESAINRARIDMGISSLTHTIDEMGVTVQRLADQLRRMDIELEAQILAQIDDEELLGQADFDPLEMDQYSSLNQLSKSLSESASDLLEFKTTMIDKTRDTESLLLQLSRTQAELQDGLMNSRMVPFSRLTPRLQRIVRQTANELGKSVELKIINADDEMDRTILERITSPLEHMLRNAVDHGIELPKDRERLGKPTTGLIVLEVLREGSEVVINLTDDGSGIDVDAVRSKAISQGLIDPNDTSLTDLDVMQYIFNAGLTTTRKVTQISGRGVGMDVVLNEIRQLGGIVSVESKHNEGSRFSMRVPLTVAISDALVVRVADSYYAIPLVQIERVVRVNPERIYDFYQSEKSTLEIDGIDYRLRYLNEILRGTGLNELAVNTNLSLPVIIVKNQTDQQLAIQVDEVAGSRIEVVVKPLGRQLSHASGISAATIMADGSVMLILDLMALLRNAPARTQLSINKDSKKDRAQALKTILIVDDSVTVRKVTSRLLERQGYATQVAKDGIDAIEILQDLKPDLMLLDIEMPRMDGFEVATQVRHDSRLKDIPIIMITSRTGDKHRQRAFEVGVNDYMGKPYQEAQLLQTVKELLGQGVHD